ncbi:hypothetical protein [Hydrogenophilus thermoluteolus]|uniref:hypothetical protein n=1 Tax=Hydrogenophilus thermoluteolus TaxID=297 RepID=UPI003F675274
MNTAFAYLTREPALNRRFQITANRLCLHASTTEQALQTLTALTPHWPQSHAVLLSLMRLPPSIKLLSWAWPENTFLEIPQQALTIPATQQLIAHCVQQETPLCLAWYDGVSPYPDAPWRFSLVDWRKCQSPDAAPGVALAWGCRLGLRRKRHCTISPGCAGGSFSKRRSPTRSANRHRHAPRCSI